MVLKQAAEILKNYKEDRLPLFIDVRVVYEAIDTVLKELDTLQMNYTLLEEKFDGSAEEKVDKLTAELDKQKQVKAEMRKVAWEEGYNQGYLEGGQKMNDKQILLKAIDTFGKDKQMDMVLEECSELMTELIIYAGHEKENVTDLISEIADVYIMIEFVKDMLRETEHVDVDKLIEDEREFKIKRLERRIEEWNVQNVK